jgi:uncharacterized membrane protein
MLIALLMISSVFLFIIAPILALGKYYNPSDFSVSKNIVWVIISLITWPLVPFILAVRRRDLVIVSIFCLSFGVWLSAMISYFIFIMSFVSYELGVR